MGRPTKQGIDFFSLDVHLDSKTKLYVAEKASAGFYVLVTTWQLIYREEGYYIQNGNDLYLRLKMETSLPIEEIRDCIQACLIREIFDSKQEKQNGILTSSALQKRYFPAASKKKFVKYNPDYLLIDVSEFKNLHNTHSIGIDSTGNATDFNIRSIDSSINATKEKEKKEGKEEEKETITETVITSSPSDLSLGNRPKEVDNKEPVKIHELQTWVRENAPDVNDMKRPLTCEQCENVLTKYTDEAVQGMLLKMHNYPPLTKKGKSAYLTLLNWLDRDEDPARFRTTNPEDPIYDKHIPSKLRMFTGFLEAWRTWIEYNKASKINLIEVTVKLQLEMLSKSPDPVAVINNAMEKSWKGLYEIKVINGYNSNIMQSHSKDIWEIQ